MNDLKDTIQPEAFEVVDDNPFFAPVSTDVIDGLIGQYQHARKQIEQVAAIVAGDLGNVMHYFIDGNCGDDRLHRSLYVDKMFATDGAIASLNSAYWSKALSLTDVYACMPQERKNTWNEQMRTPQGKRKRHSSYDLHEAERTGRALPEWEIEPLPDFEETTVRATITGLLHARTMFMAEKVDGIFRALSGSHVTNTPEAFGKRMILYIARYGSTQYDRIGYLHDLRCVIAKFMGRDEPRHQGTTNALVETAQHRSGKWVFADGGALKLRTYKCGTAHLEVHPDMAYRLNQILAHMHPHAIPAEFRQRPKRRAKDVPVLNQPLPFAVLELLCERQYPNRDYPVPGVKVFRFGIDAAKNHPAAYEQACRVLESIGGVRSQKNSHYFEFDYDYLDALDEIRLTGCVPDKQAHQFYPTPEKLAALCGDLANIGPAARCLEPQAGQGDLAAVMPKDRTLCIEISALHCAVLRSRGFTTQQGDFLAWAAATSERFDRIVCNPPFSEGRWRTHVDAALGLLAPGGRLTAILPASARHSLMLDHRITTEWHGPFDNEFAGTTASVVILVADNG